MEREQISQEEILVDQIRKARQVYVCGNGGSAATSEHFVTDLVKKGVKAIALSANTSLITMIGNDYGFDQIYAKQVEVFGTPEDLLIGISCSGTSPNVVNAVEKAREIGVKTYIFEVFKTPGHHILEDYQILENEHLRFAHAVSNLI
jgi:phosphoheptose isomerase